MKTRAPHAANALAADGASGRVGVPAARRRPAEDVLDDVYAQAVLAGDRGDPLTLAPELDQVLDLDLRLGQHW